LSVAFELPPALEAGAPPEARGLRRDDVALLVTDARRDTHRVHRFNELASFLEPRDLVVVNDSATIPAALAARYQGEEFPLHLSTQVAANLWLVEPRTTRRFEAGAGLLLAGGATAKLLAPFGIERARLWYAILELPAALDLYLHRHGKPITYSYVRRPLPLDAYQTIFARSAGSVEMPSAGRPFSLRTLQELRNRKIDLATLTLHCGVASPERHEPPIMEWMELPASTAQAVNAARAAGKRVVAVGTSVVRALESAIDRNGDAAAFGGWTEHVVGVEHPPRIVSALVTGFHEPHASHLAMLEMLASPATLREAYSVALQTRLLWHEFGDVHLILNRG